MSAKSRVQAFILLAASLVLGAAGCSQFIDQVTSREFRVRDMVSPPEPMEVLRTSNDGDARAKAMHRLKEPKKDGSAKDQDEAIEILSRAAVSDERPLCRLAAVEALGRFEDPRSAKILVQAYHSASAFPTEWANPIRCETLRALGAKPGEESLSLLTQVASRQRDTATDSAVRQAGARDDDELKKLLGRYDPEAQNYRDTRLAAVRALGETKNRQAIATLIPLLDEKDVALRDCVHAALQRITGRRDVPADAAAWRNALERAPAK